MPIFQDHQANMSASWIIILLSIIPQDLVRGGALLLSAVVCICNIANVVRPRALIKKLQLRLLSLEEKLQDSVDSGIMAQSEENFTAQIERNIGRIRYRTLELHERTLLTSGGVLQEINAVWRAHSLEIIECIWDVDALERDIEINRATILKNRYYLWR